ncbi:MAG TPA: polysaccharide biosynthesis/export family protein [Candidatus Sphingobacterium stercoripullorum]|nr:polysaccharide biosynthesis/export family protein [Candidatus Sphingobacterium stercoripullorum]
MSKYFLGLVLLVYLFLFSNCASRKDMIYLQPDSTELRTFYESNAPKLQAGDILTISVTAADVRAAAPFNPISPYQGSGTITTTNPYMPTYTIDENGEVDFPKLGKVKLAGLTRTQAINRLRDEIGKFIVDPGVNINIRNFKVTVLGEVRSPGTYTIENDRITLLEALGLAGDLTINGLRSNVLVVREQDGKKSEFRVDLTKRETLDSPVYYLAQNDVIYVEPNNARLHASKYTSSYSVFISVASLIITVISVVSR